jgi:hypothetical protein
MRIYQALAAMAAAIALGCSGGTTRVLPPSIDAANAGSQAIELYDKDGDGLVAGDELDAAPSLQAAMATLDADKDGKVSAEEVTRRVEAWQATRGGVTSVLVYVTLDGRPLSGATVTFEPESFLGQEIRTAVGVTNQEGIAAPMIPKENRPANMPPGMQLGLYKVRISKQTGGAETLPARYNAETTLGQQVAPDDPAVLKHRIEFALKSR